MTDATPLPVVQVEREPGSGRFLPGHTKVGGRKKGTIELALVFDEERRKADLGVTWKALMAKVAEGDVPAIRTVLDRLLGPVSVIVGEDEDNPIRMMDRDTAAREIASILATAAARA